MKGRGLLLIFAVGCIILFAAFAIGYANWGKFANQIGIMQILIGAVGIMIALLAVIGVVSRGKAKWQSLILATILILGFSALIFFSVGWLIAPVALILMVFSIWKLRRVHSSS